MAMIEIPQITQEYLSPQMVRSSEVDDDFGPGGGTFQRALAAWNIRDTNTAKTLYEQAIAQGLTPPVEGAARSNLGQIMLRQHNLPAAIAHFLKVLRLEQVTYDSVSDAAERLGIILTEVGRVEEGRALQALAAQAQARLGYSLSPDAKETLRQLVRHTRDAEGERLTVDGAASRPSNAALQSSASGVTLQSTRKKWWQFWGA